MNVYVREVCSAFSDRGIATDVFTRVQSDDDPRIEQLAPLSRVIYLDAGRDLDKYSLYREVPQFASRIFNHVLAEDAHYDLIYSHYWLSGEVPCALRPRHAGDLARKPVVRVDEVGGGGPGQDKDGDA